MPAFTAGGNNDADIATPTRDAVSLSKNETTTPNPEKKATGNAIRKFCFVPRSNISLVGQLSDISVGPARAAMSIPITIQNKRLIISTLNASRTNFQSRMVEP